MATATASKSTKTTGRKPAKAKAPKGKVGAPKATTKGSKASTATTRTRLKADPEQDKKALALRKEGKTLSEIVKTLGFSYTAQAWNAVNRAADAAGEPRPERPKATKSSK